MDKPTRMPWMSDQVWQDIYVGWLEDLVDTLQQGIKALATTLPATPQTAAVPPSKAQETPFQGRPEGMNHLEWYDPLNGGASRQ